MFAIARTDVAEILREKAAGEPINVHVVRVQADPQPDFDALQKVIEAATIEDPSKPR